MIRNLIRTVLLLVLVGLSASAVYPCSCEIMKPSKKLRKAKAVFVGEVVEITHNSKSEWATVVIKFKVEKYWKGAKEQYISVVSAPEGCCACGLPVVMGEKYLIYAFGTEGQLATSLCDSMSLNHATEDLSVIGKGKKLKLKT